MALNLVSAGSVASGSTSVSPSYGQSPTANNLLVLLFVEAFSGGGAAVPTGWTGDALVAGKSYYTMICHRLAAGADSAPTLTDSVSMAAVLLEFSGNDTVSPLDEAKLQNPSGSSSPQTVTNGAADVASGELMVGVSSDVLTKAGTTTTTHAYNNGATATAIANNDSSSTTLHWRFSWGITTGNSSADSLTATDSSMNLSSIDVAIASFKASAVLPARLMIVSQAVNRAANWCSDSWQRTRDGLLVPRRRIFVPV